MSRNCQLLVQPTPNCIETCRYLDEIVRDLNSNGVYVDVVKICDETDPAVIDRLEKNNINSLPVLFGIGAPRVGLKNIIDTFDALLTPSGPHREGPRVFAEQDLDTYGGYNEQDYSTTNPQDYIYEQIFSGVKRRGKRLVVPTEKDDNEEANDDIERRMRAYEARIPKHRRQSGGDSDEEEGDYEAKMAKYKRNRRREPNRDDDDDDSPPPRRRRQGRSGPPRDTVEMLEDEDNIRADGGGISTMSDRQIGRLAANITDEEVDRRMMEAWIRKSDGAPV